MLRYPNITHHGGADGVTGSCHRLQIAKDRALLIDCGLFQGEQNDGLSDFERHQVRFPVDDVMALVVTHVHIDHIGRLPYLVAAGYEGPILCSRPSAKLLPLVIEDALKVGFTRDTSLIQRFLKRVGRQLVPLDYQRWHTVVDDERHCIRVRLQRAGHILGSAYIEVDAIDHSQGIDRRIVFSGDLGPPHTPLLPDPVSPERADILVLESTYGDRCHENRAQRQRRLQSVIEHAQANGGTVIIPAFSIGRTQELLYELEDIRRSAQADSLWQGLKVVVDSPLAAKFTEVYRELKPWWDEEAQARLVNGRHPLSFEGLVTVDDHDEHLSMVESLASSGTPAVVIAASGMATGGRVVNYLKRMLPDERHAVVFVGYQAKGTPGRDIQRYGAGSAGRPGWVKIDGEKVLIRAMIKTVAGYSAHADQADLVRFVTGIDPQPGEVRLVHGEEGARRELGKVLREKSHRMVVSDGLTT
ncbi:MBL fold metallo-hydrolase RNA specificity domain-containing protein [Halomonas sp. V046]|uniref:MBL fold metallo-hydrolase RNA specificity domain-containing protein n=1 Tax=Halomonas sp. V046 TaxID=3459611 RepID=UPI004043E2D3